MTNFTYIALNAQGAESTGRLDAPDIKQAAILLRGQGLFPTDVTPTTSTSGMSARSGEAKTAGSGLTMAWQRVFGCRVKLKEMAVFTRQLAALLHAGVPLLRGLEVLARQERNLFFRRVLATAAEAIKSGSPLSEALVLHPQVFDRLYLNMVKAGEAGGALDVVLERLAQFQEKSLKLRGKVASAVMYPLIVLAVALLILVGLLGFVVPKFQQIFADLLKGAPLPALTQLVLTVSQGAQHHFLTALGFGVAAGLGLQIYRRTAEGARRIDSWIITLPLFGELLLKDIIVRFVRTLGTLLSSGVPLLPALLIARDTCGNARVAGAISAVHDRVKEGATIARSLENTTVFPPMVTSMIDVGEHTGQLPAMLHQVAAIYEDEVDNAVAGLSSLIEPILILFLALVVGTIVIALFLPIVRIVQLLT